MITEDYVSFETAKLLKEKGFDEPCYQYYLTTKTLHTTFHDRMHVEEEPFFNSSELNGLYEVADKTLFEDICSAPTLQLAMKWLREVHSITIGITFSCGLISYEIHKNGEFITSVSSSRTYEQMVEEAIKLCLENLI